MVVKDRSSLDPLFFKPWTMSLFLKRLLVQILMVSSRLMLVKNESISILSIKLLEYCSTISEAKLNGSLNVYLLVVSGSYIRFFLLASTSIKIRIRYSKRSIQNKQIVIQKSDTGNSILIVDKERYIKRWRTFWKLL